MKYLILICSIFLGNCSIGQKENKSNTNMDLETTIEKKLEEAIKKFEPSNIDFSLTIFHQDTAIIQVVNCPIIEQVHNNKFGFALHLTFDLAFNEDIENQKKFEKMEISKSFIRYDWEGIPCYVLDLGKDSRKTAKLLTQILTDLYGYDKESKFEIELKEL